jgi:V-type H+-transporting ATPase subunit C
MSVEEYVKKFKWDDVKYARSRSIQDNLQLILSSVQKIDEEVKNKTQQYTDAKQHAAYFARKEQASHVQRDLVDLLTPDTVQVGDFVYSEHLTTLLVVVPRGSDQEFINHYQSFDQYIVPESAQRVTADDKEGNSLWRVVMFKTAVDAFKTSCRQHRYTVRDFTYDKNRYKEVMEARQSSETELRKQESVLRRVCQAAFSDAVVAWTHLKAIRTFVEAVLRFGVPPNFGAYLIKPGKYSGKQSKLRSELMEILASNGIFGNSFANESKGGDGSAPGAEEEGGEYYPYVNIGFTPTSGKTI